MGEYANVQIRITEKVKRGYPIELTLNYERQLGRGYLDPEQIPELTYSADYNGEQLFRWLVADREVAAGWGQIRGEYSERRIRLRIDASAPELHTLPWELLREVEEGSVGLDLAASKATPFSRYLSGRWQTGGPIFSRPVRILVAIANPAGLGEGDHEETQPIDVEEEWNLLQEATAGLVAERAVKLTLFPGPGTASETACTFEALETELRRGHYHILHFIGHGGFSERSKRTALLMANEDNQIRVVRGEQMARMLARQLADANWGPEDKLRLVFLASCETGTSSPENAFSGLAPKLIQASVPAVLAMQRKVEVETARKFASAFYESLLEHGYVDKACNDARSKALTAESIGDAGLTGAAIPVLFSRLPSCQLLGEYGRITGADKDFFWNTLIENIDFGECVPILGPGILDGLLPSRASAAEALAQQFQYPLPDKQDLAKVVQFATLKQGSVAPRRAYARFMRDSLHGQLELQMSEEEKRKARKDSFTKRAADLKWREQVLKEREDETHHLLADLELPLYVTTNFDSFMVEALLGVDDEREAEVRRLVPRWERGQDDPKHPAPLIPEPSDDAPVVLQLNGHDGAGQDIKSLILSEEDYLRQYLRLARDLSELLPSTLKGLLTRNSLLLLGYRLDDWEFRIIVHGLIKHLERQKDRPSFHVGVQLDSDQAEHADQVMEYFRDYLGEFDISIYWGKPQQFVAELHRRWRDYAGGD